MLRAYICFLGKTRHCSLQSRSFITASRPVAARKTPPRIKGNTTIIDSPVQETPSLQRPRNGSTHVLFRRLRKAIQSDDQELIASRVTKHVDRYINKHYSNNVYDNVIRLLLKHSCIPAAVAVYDRVVACGFIFSAPVKAQMFLVSSSNVGDKPMKRLPLLLRRIIRSKTFAFDDLLEVLERMARLDLPSEMLHEAMSIFHQSHPSPMDFIEPNIGSLRRVVNLDVQHGFAEHALEALSTLPQSGIDKTMLPNAYASFVSAIRRSLFPDHDAVSAAIDQMQKQGIEANLAVWNALIAFEVRTNSLHRPFAIYDVLKNHSEFLPDDYTFGSLFNALNRFYNSKRRRYRHGELLPSNIPSPRALYQEMLEALVRDPKHPTFEFTTSLLNVALRSFVYSKDYAGAYVVIRAFSTFNVPVSAKTYLIVFRHLMNRVTYGIRAIRRMGSDTWADRFLGLPYPITNPGFLSDLQLGNDLARQLLTISKRQSFKRNIPLYIAAQSLDGLGPERYHTPTVEEMLGKSEMTIDQNFDAVPLERLLKKALLAEWGSMREHEAQRPASLYLSTTISDVKREMVPPQLNKRLSNMRRRTRTIYSSA